MVQRKYIVYCHTLISDGRKYIGITCNNPRKRWNYGNGYRKNKYFYRAIKKYGWDSFKHDILFEDLTKEEACQKEQELIREFKTTDNAFGFNLTSGGEGTYGFKFSEESKKKMSLAKKGWKPPKEATQKSIATRKANGYKGAFYGKKLSEEHKRHISEGHMGMVFTEDRKRHISETKKGKKYNRPNYSHSEETKRKIGDANRGQKRGHLPQEQREKISLANRNNSMSKPIMCVELGTLYPSLHEATRQLGIDASNISACCRGKYKTTHGYTFRYVEVLA